MSRSRQRASTCSSRAGKETFGGRGSCTGLIAARDSRWALAFRHGTGPDRRRRAARARLRRARGRGVRDPRRGPRRGRQPARAGADPHDRGERGRRRRPARGWPASAGTACWSWRPGTPREDGLGSARQRVPGRPPVRQHGPGLRVRRGAELARFADYRGRATFSGLRAAARRAAARARRASACATGVRRRRGPDAVADDAGGASGSGARARRCALVFARAFAFDSRAWRCGPWSRCRSASRRGPPRGASCARRA